MTTWWKVRRAIVEYLRMEAFSVVWKVEADGLSKMLGVNSNLDEDVESFD